MSTRIILTYAAVAVPCLLAVSCGLKKEKIEPAPPVKVEVMVAGQPTTDLTGRVARSYTGTVEAGEGADLSFSVAGTIERMPVRQGQKVTKGQLLAAVRSGSLDDVNNAAQAELAQARDAYARLKKLHDANALPDIKWVEVQTRLSQAEKAAAVAARTAGDASIYAPYSGVVAQKIADVGQTVAPGMPVLRLVSDGDVKVSISVPEGEVASFAEGSQAAVTFDALAGREVTGVLAEKGVEADMLTRGYDVKYGIPNPAGDILPGMICTVVPAASQPDSTSAGASVVLPVQAVLLSADNRHFVWIADAGKASRRWVEQSGMVPDGIVITAGIAPGDSVIVVGMQKVSNGTSVVTSVK